MNKMKIIVGVLLLLKVYGVILGIIAKFPLAPRLFELAGIIWLIQFSSNNLIKSQDRADVIKGLKNRWKQFSDDS